MNRVAKKEDVYLYGEQVKDDGKHVIIDSPTKFFTDGSVSMNYYFMRSREWKDLPDEVTFWVDGNKLGFVNEFKMQNGAEIDPWMEQATFKALSPVKAGSYSIKGANDLLIDGQAQSWTKDRHYMTGGYGFHAIQGLENGHGFHLTVQDGGSIVARGFEAQHGFAGIRVQDSGAARIANLLLENFYLHDMTRGEGQYIGSTKAGVPIPYFEKVIIRNGVIARAAAESLQLQNMANAHVHNITIYQGATDWLFAFQPFQSSGIQFVANGGTSVLERLILDGYGTGGFMPHGVGAHAFIAGILNQVTLKDSVFYAGRGSGMYGNKSMVNGNDWLLDNVLFGGFDDSYYKHTGNAKKPMIRSVGSDRITLNITHDGSSFPLTDKLYPGVITQGCVPRPRYINSGFDEPAGDVMRWKQFYAPYFEGPDNTPTVWEAGKIAIDTTNGYRFYKCVKEHTATELRPYENLNFIPLLWDDKGIRSDKGGVNATHTIPPDNLGILGEYSSWGAQLHAREKIVDEFYLGERRFTLTDSGRYYQD